MRKKSNKPLYHRLPTGIYLKIPIDVKCSYVFFFFFPDIQFLNSNCH